MCVYIYIYIYFFFNDISSRLLNHQLLMVTLESKVYEVCRHFIFSQNYWVSGLCPCPVF
jgi:hypothetical protein